MRHGAMKRHYQDCAMQSTDRSRLGALIATDGGSKGTGFEDRVASFGVAVGDRAWKGNVGGLDQASYKSELWALFKLMTSIRGMNHRVTVIIDNQAVAREAALRAHGKGNEKNNCARLWQRIQEAINGCPRIEFHWAPSHGKKEGLWAPRDGFREQEWRGLNKAADTAATEEQDKN